MRSTWLIVQQREAVMLVGCKAWFCAYAYLFRRTHGLEHLRAVLISSWLKSRDGSESILYQVGERAVCIRSPWILLESVDCIHVDCRRLELPTLYSDLWCFSLHVSPSFHFVDNRVLSSAMMFSHCTSSLAMRRGSVQRDLKVWGN